MIIISESLEAQLSLDAAKARHEELSKIEKSIAEIKDVFVEIALLVEDQGSKLDSIEHHVNKSMGNSVHGTKKLEKAKKRKRKHKRGMFDRHLFSPPCLFILSASICAPSFAIHSTPECTPQLPEQCIELTPPSKSQDDEPNSLDQLLQFTEDGVCRADGVWSMDYWDPYGLDEGLLGSIAIGVPTSIPPEAPTLVRATHVIVGPPMDTATPTKPPGILSPAPLSPAPLYVEGNTPPSVWADMDTLDRLICQK
uniref:t-SNARE coiled-coil homology domain-containing protein n=1 Tax=Timema shepardi TaxID=629360 RepID=A0A7R9AQE1_TIMSH|nr:unnamed protein product [Timema shepardi]